MGSTTSNHHDGRASDRLVITFTVGCYDIGQRPAVWQPLDEVPAAVLDDAEFRAMFDAAGETTVDTTGDISPLALRDILDAQPGKRTVNDELVRWLAVLAHARGERIGWTIKGR